VPESLPISARPKILLPLAYAAIFPITNLVGGGISLLGIAVTLPFLPVAWVVGMAAVSITHSEAAYLAGASLGVLVQVLLLIWVYAKIRKGDSVNAPT
jgi:hypothetical protein